MADPFIGEIRMFAGNFAPNGWQMCNGQTLAISQYTALFSIIGTYFGGNGTSTFQLPDMRGRVPLHQGTGLGLSPYVLGEQAGTQSVTILNNNMPIHNHLVNADGNAGGKTTPIANFPGIVSGNAQEKMYSAGPSNGTMAPTMIGPAGGNVPIQILQPLLCVTFIIALVGIFPSRN